LCTRGLCFCSLL